MGNKPKITDAQFKASEEIYNIARQEADIEMARLKSEIEVISEESRYEGILAKINYDILHNEFLKLAVLYRVKQSKDYKKGGRTWAEFCAAHGYADRTADRLLEEMKPLFQEFSAGQAGFLGLLGLTFSKIRYLGRSVSANLVEIKDGCLVYDDQLIPLDVDHKDEIEAVLDQLKDDAETAKKEKTLDIKAKDRVLHDKEKTIQKLNKNLEKLEGQAKEKGLLPEEDGFLKKVEFLRTAFDGYLLQLDPVRMEELSKHNDPAPTPRMRAAYLAALDYMKKQILVAFDQATEMYGNAIMCPEDAWQPGMGAAITPAKETSAPLRASTTKKSK
jgi:hypothetical protein